MLSLHAGHGQRDCSGLSRRDFLTAGTLGLGSLTLPWLLRNRAAAAEGETSFVRDRAVIMVFLGGGASHIETFNPNMDAPEPYHSVTGEVKTSVPGITFGGTFPLIARQMHRAAIVRSFRHPIGGHAQAINHVLTGGTDPKGDGSVGFSIGSMYSRLRGPNNPATGMPTYALLTDPHQDPQYKKEFGRVISGSRPGPLGASYAPFVPTSAKDVANMTLNLPPDRLEDRRSLLKRLDELKRGIDARDAEAGYDQFERQALDLLTGGAADAFDVTKEKKATVERYDTSMFKTGKKTFEPSRLGRHMLMARRLVEAGCGFVTVQSAGWDMHADGNNPGVEAGMQMLGTPLDKALSALLEDLEQRGLADRVLVIVTGDFGRTPKINKNGGRDHWANLCTLALFGGGLKTGQVIGKSDRNNGVPATDPISTPNLLATVMHTLFDAGVLRVTRGVPADLKRLIESTKPIEELF